MQQVESSGTINPRTAEALTQYYFGLEPTGPIYLQFYHYLSSVLHGNLGVSIIYNEPVSTLIAQTLPYTLFIIITSTLLAFAVGTVWGMRLGYRRNTKSDTTATVGFTVVHAVPVYIWAVLLLFYLGFIYHVFPHGGAYGAGVTPGFNFPFIASLLYHSTLPILTLFLASVGGWMLGMRSNTITTLGEDFVRFAELSGVPPNRVASRYVGRNAILPQVTGVIISIAGAFSGSVFVEQTFSYPGIGNLLYNSVTVKDYPVEMGVFIMVITAVMVGTLLADLVYGLLDPRVKVGRS
jgi:ABC-type dipeptide/oligopeptide/nickel transport systems, permease components